MIIIKFLLIIVSALAFLYSFWIKLKEDYLVDTIFTVAFTSLFSGLLFYFFAIKFVSFWWFWMTLLGLTLGLMLGVVRFRFHALETFNAFIYGLMPAYLSLFFYKYLVDRNLILFYASVIIFGFYLLFVFTDSNYKRFTWYKSGRAGFAGLFITGLFFSMRAVIAYFTSNVLSFTGMVDVYLSVGISLTSFITLFKLSR